MKKIVNVKNLKKDFKDPDLGSYGRKLPVVNKKVMQLKIAGRKLKKRLSF